MRAPRNLGVLTVVALVAATAFAVGAASRREIAGIDARLTSDTAWVLFDVAIWVGVGLALVGTAWAIRDAWRWWHEERQPRAPIEADRSNADAVRRMVVLVLATSTVFALILARMELRGGGDLVGRAAPPPLAGADAQAGTLADTLLPAIVVTATVAVAILVMRPRRRPVPVADATQAGDTQRDARIEALDEGLEALTAEKEPRRAVIAAYAAMERAMARHGWPPASHEAPTEYVGRVLGVIPGRARDLDDLATLYELARFSEHPISEAMRSRAIDAVERLRRDVVRAIDDGPYMRPAADEGVGA